MNTKDRILGISFSAALACGAVFGTAGVASAATLPSAVPAMTQAAEVTITISGFAYTVSGPVTPGATVTVVNNDGEVHTVTGRGSGQSFDSGTIASGASGTFTAPNSPGEYNFVCIFHGTMSGTLVVQEGPASSGENSEDDTPAQAGNMNEGQMGRMPVGGADTGAEQQPGGSLGLLALGAGFVLVAAGSGTYLVRRRSQ